MSVLRCAPPGVPSTEVLIGVDLARELEVSLSRLGNRARFALVDARVAAPHAHRLAALQQRLTIDGGEASKTFPVLEHVLRSLARAAVDRDTLLAVAGGGSVGDLGGLAAALYARGLDLVLIPTTLLAMVDSSVGGKTAIDLPEGKNLVGILHPARVVLIDLAFLGTLPETEFRSGLGELLKMAIGLSAALIELLEAHADAVVARDTAVLTRCVELALTAKIAVVEGDFAERGSRRLLNLGHTLGHALEAHSGYTLPHGHAVARGLHFAINVAERDGHLSRVHGERGRQLLAHYGFVAERLPPLDALDPFLRRDKKATADGVHFIVPTAIGASASVHTTWTSLAAALTAR